MAVIDTQTGIRYASAKQAARAADTTEAAIIDSCQNNGRWRFTTLPKKRPVRCEQTGNVFPSYLAAARALDVPQPHISRHMVGELKHVKGFTFTHDTEPAPLIPCMRYTPKPRHTRRVHNNLFGPL